MTAPSRVLVTGASGAVGSATCRQLTRTGVRVRAGMRRPGTSHPGSAGKSLEKVLADGVELETLDYDRPRTFPAALADVTKLFVIPPPGGGGDPFALLRPLVEAGLSTLSHVVLLTGDGVQHFEGIPLWRLEQWVKRCGVPWTILRPNWFMENVRRRQSVAVREEGRLVAPAGDGRCAFVDVADVVASAAVALTRDGHEGREYALTGPESLTHAEVARHLGDALGRPVRFDDVTSDEFRRYLIERESQSAAAAEALAASYLAIPLGIPAEVTGDVPRLLGRPATDFATFARRDAPNWSRTGRPAREETR